MKKYFNKIIIFVTLSLLVTFSTAHGAYRDGLSEFTQLQWDYLTHFKNNEYIFTSAITDEGGDLITIDAGKLNVNVGNNITLSNYDPSTNALMIEDYSHSEIHDGNHYLYSDSITLANNVSQDYLITTPDTSKYAHMIRILDGSAITEMYLYEATDKTGTTLQTTRNRDRNSGNTSGVIVHKGTSGGTTDGVLISQYKSGSATNQSRNPSSNPANAEIILKRNTKYILRITSKTNDNLVNVLLDWYEHTNL